MDTLFPQVFPALDAILIAPFRLFPRPGAGFICGMAVLALGSALLGRACLAGLARLQRPRREREEGEAKKHHHLSLRALQAKDRTAYLASNRLAQEAYGNAMALAAGRAAAGLWPGCLALAWAHWRFSGLPLPLVGDAAGPAAFFIPLYLLAQWGLARVFRRAPGPRSDPSLPPSPFDD
jgi:hypothetical protein